MNRAFIYFVIFPLVFLSQPSSSDGIVIYEGEREVQLNEQYKVSKCGKISLAECPMCLDTPNYYFKSENKQLISRCQGACWHPTGDQARICKTLCPPPEWSCAKLIHSTPLHGSDEVLAEFFDQSKIDRAKVKIEKFGYDYIKGIWYIELQPLNGLCIDCYPSFYFKNSKELVLQSIKHG